MGLFDIFKRKNQQAPDESQSESASISASESAASAAESVSVATTSAATSVAEATESTATAEPTTDATSTVASESPASTTRAEADVQSTTETTSTATSTSDAEPEQKYENGLSKSRSSFGQSLNRLFANFRSVDEEFFDDLEDTLIQADVGVNTATSISDQLREAVRLNNIKGRDEVQNFIVQKLVEIYDGSEPLDTELHENPDGPTIILMIGVNGAGKTTTIGKLANQYRQAGKKVLVAAADTFRAGAIEQLAEWAERDQVAIVKKPEGSDPASVVFDAVKQAKDDHYDILLVDTAGRLQNKVNLMKELEKMNKIIQREIPGAPQEVLLVIDATIGQNALVQAKMFRDVAEITGIVLTKLDGTAKGGIVLAIKQELGIPVKYVGLGEGVDDLQTFNPEDFVYGLFKGLIKE
ncbi:signal recognition particle-docking protein FtsY [Fructilactobacillus myrtifloralis]|uniref:Signal recognition particle receptor FtsY n=1 Tax=Fructilactobacillus myrtifloralis TaxID=2940301 RepID=A0ABY5BNP5_9LACO|nr:signal recognition particle-docking protein FtsY [Fructilactobacillus myrtifloralis]USS85304.1 signal recognition particle-docking protein FtsY [Fructilactobacillus myrtifloralis]